MGSELLIQSNIYQSPWAKWGAAFAGRQGQVDADGRQKAYVFKPGEGNENVYTPEVRPVDTNFFINPTTQYTGSVGGFGNVQDDHKPTYAMHDTTFTTGDPRLAHDRHDFMLFA